MDTNRIGESVADMIFDKNRCKRCGKKIDGIYKRSKALWCKSCRAYVDSELRGENNQPFSFYFKYYQWQKLQQAELNIKNKT